ncbi:TetR family transcriptional regulator [uncultured Veillonella sp.]|uniref:TetR family transcriptional regulator n=1 Tax=uncultured Veillonella sp. TaxID=159268 RepID=UPI00262958F3|nr:TetR family transcriptional regulator [uncultured Veillonella sp.]
MARVSKDKVLQRPDEIIDACETLYKTKRFSDVSLKDISEMTSLSRPSIYNYFKTKEEIFLSLLTREYKEWIEELRAAIQPSLTYISSLNAEATRTSLTHSVQKIDHECLLDEAVQSFARIVAKSLASHELLLRIQCTNLYEIEENSRIEFLVEFKHVFKEAIMTVDEGLAAYFPHISEQARGDFSYAFFPFIYGVYPYVYPSAKQKLAMDEAAIQYKAITIEQIIYACVEPLLRGLVSK